jgi:hypothetical protein
MEEVALEAIGVEEDAIGGRDASHGGRDAMDGAAVIERERDGEGLAGARVTIRRFRATRFTGAGLAIFSPFSQCLI